jgi:hypothetical protein
MSKWGNVTAERIVKLNKKYDGDTTKFMKFSGFNKDGKSNYWSNFHVTKDGKTWKQCTIRFKDEKMASVVKPASDEDAATMTNRLGYKDAITSRTNDQGIIQVATFSVSEYPTRIETDSAGQPKGELPPDSEKSYLVQALIIVNTALQLFVDKSIADNKVVLKKNPKFPEAFKVKNFKFMEVVASCYSDECKSEELQGQPMANRVARVKIPFGKDKSIPKGHAYKRATKTPKLDGNDEPIYNKKKEQQFDITEEPLTFPVYKDGKPLLDEDGAPVMERATDNNIHNITPRSILAGEIKISCCWHGFGVSAPKSVKVLSIIEPEVKNVTTTEDLYGESSGSEEDEEEAAPKPTTYDDSSGSEGPDLEGLTLENTD